MFDVPVHKKAYQHIMLAFIRLLYRLTHFSLKENSKIFPKCDKMAKSCLNLWRILMKARETSRTYKNINVE